MIGTDTCMIVIRQGDTFAGPVSEETRTLNRALAGAKFVAKPVGPTETLYLTDTGELLHLTPEELSRCAQVSKADVITVLRERAPNLVNWFNSCYRSDTVVFQETWFLTD